MTTRFSSIFSKLFASLMLALVLFAMAMIGLTHMLKKSNSNMVRSEAFAAQVINQIEPLLHEIQTSPNQLDNRLSLATIKESFDIFDASMNAKIGLYNSRGELLIQTEGSDLSRYLLPTPSWLERTFPVFYGAKPVTSVQVFSPLGFTLSFEMRESPNISMMNAMFNLFTGTCLLLMIMAFVSWWLAHSITWRIHRLSEQIQAFGEGDFSVRVPITGKDEVATLATGFNQSAEKIEKLINANNLLLAHASHEFRTPITRIRLQVEMMDMIAEQLPKKVQPMFMKRANAITKDLTGLNDLIESILLVSRLDAGHALQQVEDINLYQLIEQEVQHYPQACFCANLQSSHLTLEGQPKLLTHLIRNLLNNAMIHGIPPIAIYAYSVETMHDAKTIPNDTCNKHNTAHDVSQDCVSSPTNQQVISGKETAHSTNHNTTQKNRLKHKFPAKSKFTMPMMPSMPSRHLKTMQQHTDKASHRYIAISVVDQGSGIPKEKREDIFSPFVRLKQEKKGSGLGLSLVAQIVESHQGRISTDTWQGQTRFLIVLPIRQANTASVVTDTQPATTSIEQTS